LWEFADGENPHIRERGARWQYMMSPGVFDLFITATAVLSLFSDQREY